MITINIRVQAETPAQVDECLVSIQEHLHNGLEQVEYYREEPTFAKFTYETFEGE